jgi:ABC-type multidrug transport system fused ATPase/permease subunit
MKYLRSFTTREKRPVVMLDLLFIIYILFDIGIPVGLAKLIDNSIGKFIIILISLSMFYLDPITGILSLLVAYSLIKRSAKVTGSVYKQSEDNAEEIKMNMLDNYNSLPKTLEEDVISNMAPIIKNENDMISEFKPVLDNLNNAAPVNEKGKLL